MDIIDAKLEDEKEFIDMETTFSKTSACSQEISKEMAKKNFDAAINGAYSRILMFKEDDKTIGYGYLSKSHSTEKGGISIWLEELYVKENYRGGVGKKFLSFLNDEYKNNAKCIRLEVSTNNERAKKLYKNEGFKEVKYKQMYKDI